MDEQNLHEESNKSVNSIENLSHYTAQLNQVIDECEKIVIGQRELLELILICILSEGHVLLEGVPGIAKTLSTKVISKTIDSGFSRIQFTPDLMPSDVIGTSIFDVKKSEFVFKKGPIFSNLVLIDEINRAPAKTQAALFEVMEEKQITYDGVQYEMGFPFIIIATQNPIEQEGTYRLPEGQLDRFLMKIVLDYPSQKDEFKILNQFKNSVGKINLDILTKKLTEEQLKELQLLVSKIYVEDEMLDYIVKMTYATRSHSKIFLGASPRASTALLRCSKAVALLAGRDFVIPDDIQYVAPHIYNHRIILTPDAELEAVESFDVINEIIENLEVPR